MINPDFFLKKYGIDTIIKDCDEDDGFIRMIEAFGVRGSCNGDEPYIFISYSHKNSSLVLPAIKAFQDKGYPVWYDAGINPGTEWLRVIAEKIDHAALVIAFVSQESIESRFCKSEISRAYNKEKPLLEVRLDRCELPGEMEMQLDGSQRFKAYAYDDGNKYIELLVNTPIIATYVKPVLKEDCQIQPSADYTMMLLDAKKRQEALEEERRQQELAEQQRTQEEQKKREEERWHLELAEQQKAQEKQKKLAIERENNKREMEKCALEIQSLLKSKSYRQAIDKYNSTMRGYAKPELSLKKELMDHRKVLCMSIYQDACDLEKSKKTRDRLFAGKLFDALPYKYVDDSIGHISFVRQKKKIEKNSVWLFPIVYLLLNFAALFVLRWLEPWYWKILVLTVPMLVSCCIHLYIAKVYGVDCKFGFFAVKWCVNALLLVNPFLLSGMEILWRILMSIGVMALNHGIWYILFEHIPFGIKHKDDIPYIVY